MAATVLAVGVFASLASVGYAAGLVPFVHTSPTAAQYPTSKVTICHHTHSQKNPFVTITVSEHALPAHLGHGDTVGPCPQTGTTGATGAAGPVIVATELVHKGKAKGHQKGSVTAAHATVKSHGQGHAYGHSSTNGHGNSQGHGHANGHSSTHGHGNGHGNNGNGHGHDSSQSHGHGQGHGQGHGPSGTHGNSGGNGKGNKH